MTDRSVVEDESFDAEAIISRYTIPSRCGEKGWKTPCPLDQVWIFFRVEHGVMQVMQEGDRKMLEGRNESFRLRAEWRVSVGQSIYERGRFKLLFP